MITSVEVDRFIQDSIPSLKAGHPEMVWNDLANLARRLANERDDVREKTINQCRAICLEVNGNAAEAAKAKDATDYVAGYQDAAVDCDEEIRKLL